MKRAFKGVAYGVTIVIAILVILGAYLFTAYPKVAPLRT